MTLEREIKLLKEKIELLEKIKELEMTLSQPYYPYPVCPSYPYNPPYWTQPIITYETT